MLPSGKATVRAGRRKIGKAVVVAEKSTPPGPHPRGVLVKLTLRMEGGAAWPESAEIELEPHRARGASLAPRNDGRVKVHYTGPARGEPPRA